jgi:hypothetical protein
LTAEEILDSPHVFIGSITDLTRKFADLRERFGISPFLIDDLDALAPVVEELAGRCPSPGSLPKPPVSGRGHMISLGIGHSSDGSVTVRAKGIPAGDIMVVGIETSGHSSLSGSALTSAPAPSCISLPTLPSGNGSAGSVTTAG